MSKYQRSVEGVTIDVYDVLVAFCVHCPARQHAIKKLLLAGERGHKEALEDLEEAGQAVERAVELESEKVRAVYTAVMESNK